MRHAPDPRVLVEVALVQLTHDEAGGDADALLARIERLETTVKQLREQGVAAAAVPKDPSTGRAVLGGAARWPAPSPASRTAHSDPAAAAGVAAAESPAAADDAPDAGRPPAARPEPTPSREAAAVSVPDAWEHTVKAQVKPLVRALFSAGSFVGNRGDTWLFSVPNEAHGNKCEDHRAAVEAALSAAVGGAVAIEFVTGGAPAADTGTTTAPSTSAASTGADRPRPRPAAAPAALAAPASSPPMYM